MSYHRDVLDRLLAGIRRRRNRRVYAAGARVSRFVATDVQREVEIVDASDVDDGYVQARVRTWNVMYVARGLATKPGFGEARRVGVESLWIWHGPDWGGPVVEYDDE